MSVSSPAKSLLSKSNAFLRSSPSDLRLFHTSSAVCARRRPRYASIRADDIQTMQDLQRKLVHFSELDQSTKRRLRKHNMSASNFSPTEDQLTTLNKAAAQINNRYGKEHKEALKLAYTPAQVAAIRAAEHSIDDRDFLTQGKIRRDGARIKYNDDDFSKIDYLYDKQQKDTTAWPLKQGEDINLKTEDQLYAKLAEFIQSSGKKYVNTGKWQASEDTEDRAEEGWLEEMEVDWEKFATNPRTLFNAPNEETYKLLEQQQLKATAAELPRLSDRISRNTATDIADEEDPSMTRSMLRTGLSADDLRKIYTKVLVRRHVVNQTRMGKIGSSSMFAVAGNRNGMIGIGHGKSTEPTEAAAQARARAIRNMKPILRYENRTIYGEVFAKVGATEVTLTAKHPGFGNRAMHIIFEICKMAGIQDIRASVPRSRNPMNIVKATFEALHKQKLPEDIARGRGRKLVDVRKVYYGGKTL
ncbi:hypothetical protein EJ05DRAFT_460580 [Pseudovirgaria hyperparasitica]|uniref:Small ribosomal subunit protein uS5m n=1 Tax=Pseudovirgaria hyperparasitica TaxID=470096 RepID=A0A6A6WI41_9PEZI|nr:uncharacterized protein EJ05DRAFT_460580 [Pseudovirgaria hyperparasitica]KAF2761754.1 hypothetical protein EJ05DRAFT_460580 [Pseudovirgaria hyperparasitica]